MRTIEKEAAEYARKKYLRVALEIEENVDAAIFGGLVNAFIHGADFAQRWISVGEELPERSMKTITNGPYIHTANPVLVKTSNNKCAIVKRWQFLDHGWRWAGSGTLNKSITHWRCIELE